MPNLVLSEFNDLQLPGILKAKILAVHNAPEVFHSEVVPFKEGEPFTLRTVIGSDKWISCYKEAMKDEDNVVMGNLLGYPECCSKFFQKHWKEQEEKDFTWQSMGSISNLLTHAVIDPLLYNNQMYSKLGVRPYYHMPCSVRCHESNELAKKYLKLWKHEERYWLEEILSWPVEWSALHGAAEIRTPVCKIITDTEPTDTEHVVQFARGILPNEAGRGNRFPYCQGEDIYSNNGFTSLEGMTEAHELILEVAKDAKDVVSIIDPGCGNGRLLDRLCMLHAAVGSGCDTNHHAIAQGLRLYSDLNLAEGNLFMFNSSSDMVVFMPGRLLENLSRADGFVRDTSFRYLLLYGYSAYAHKVCELKKQYWPDCKTVNLQKGEHAIAMLLEK